MKPLLIIKTGKAIQGIPPELQDFEHWIADCSGQSLGMCRTVSVIDGEQLPPSGECCGVVVTGSAAMVTDRHDWSEYSAEWLRQAITIELPILGICYGHQLLAHALGGVVGYHPQGREIGTKPIHRTVTALDDELFSALPPQFPAHTTHLQSVLQLPQDAEVLAWNSFEAHHAVRFAPRCWGVQFHPEFSTEAMLHYLRVRGDALHSEGLNVAQLNAEVEETPHARALLQRFVALARNG